jgi:regulatory protein
MNSSYDILLKKAASYTSRQETCRWAVESKLRAWGASPTQSKSIIAYLEQEQYLDETRFSKSFASDKFRFNQWGKIKIAKALEAKRIPASVFQPVLDAMDEENYMHTISTMLEKKSHEITAKSKYEKQGKLINFALRRGFEYDVVEHILELHHYYE